MTRYQMPEDSTSRAQEHPKITDVPTHDVGQWWSANRPDMTVSQEAQAFPDADHHELARGEGYKDAHEHQAALTEQIRAQGIREPLTQDSSADWGYPADRPTLGDGLHRWMAAKQLGHKTVPVKPYEHP